MTGRWLTLSDAAAVLRLHDREVRELALRDLIPSRTDVDHVEVSADGVSALQQWAGRLAAMHRSNPMFMMRLALYSSLRREGLTSWDAAAHVGRDGWSAAPRYERWMELLGDQTVPTVSECAGLKAEVVAENAKPSVGRWARADEPESFADRADYDTPTDEGDNT